MTSRYIVLYAYWWHFAKTQKGGIRPGNEKGFGGDEAAGVCMHLLFFPSSFIVGGWSGVLAGVDECGEYHSRRPIEWHEMELLGLSFISLGLCFILSRKKPRARLY